MGMSKEQCKFNLSVNEFRILTQLPLEKALADTLNSPSSGTIWLTRDEAENLRDLLTEQLAATGFDADYSINQQGQILEALIDRFYVP
jgi:hypothetical protein